MKSIKIKRLLHSRARFALGVILAALLVTALLGGGTVRAATVVWPSINLHKVSGGFSMPVAITHSDDSSGRIYVVEQAGTIRILWNGALVPAPFLDIHTIVNCCVERGLLGLAFPPGYSVKGYFYVYYTNLNGDNVIARYNTSSNPALADPASGVVVLTIAHPTFANHNGGQLAFGPDGFLYVGVGDGGGGGDINNHAQSLNSLLGKLLRLNVEGAGCVQNPPKAQNYCIPAGNPFVSTAGAMPEIWDLGLRNPWRFSFDRQTGDLYIADVGQNIEEEVDFRAAGSSGGVNFGWHILEGNLCFSPATGCVAPANYVAPVATYDHGTASSNGCSVTGGYTYRGPNIFLNMQGVYFYADYCKGKIYGLKNDGGWQTTLLTTAPFPISTFGEDSRGSIYVADYVNGVIYQLQAAIIQSALPFKNRVPQIFH